MKREQNNIYFDNNKALWDAKTPIHLESQFYDLDSFKKGTNSLRKIELNELPDVKGKTILHSQCHFGQDTLSLERMGAICTGIDLSTVSIQTAYELRDELDLKSKFICCNVYDIGKNIDDLFDIVFTSYGVIAWLPDLELWAEILASRIKEGGYFYMAEFHPVLYMFDWETNKIEYEYFNVGKPLEEINEGTYVDKNADLVHKEYFWQHSLSEVLNALIKSGLEIQQFNEHDYSPYDCFDNLKKRGEQEYVFQHNNISIPHVFSILARKIQ